MVNRAGGWKGYVSYGLGADISLPPCQIGGRHRVWHLTNSISDTRHGTSLLRLEVLLTDSYFLVFAGTRVFTVPQVLSAHVQVFIIVVITIIKKEMNGQWTTISVPGSTQFFLLQEKATMSRWVELKMYFFLIGWKIFFVLHFDWT